MLSGRIACSGPVMLEYIHFVPGRLRLKISRLRNYRSAAEAEAFVAEIPSVKAAVANPATGSLTITFDRQRLSIGDLWEILRAEGYASGPRPEPRSNNSGFRSGPEANRFGHAVFDALLDALVRHSAQTLVRNLL